MMVRFLPLVLLSMLAPGLHAQSPQRNNTGEAGLFVWISRVEGVSTENRLSTWLNEHPEFNRYRWKKAFTTNAGPLNRIYVVTGFPSADDRESILAVLKKEEAVELAEVVPQYRFFHTPNDLTLKQWNLRTIQAEAAWDISKGGKDILVGLVDDGMDTAHIDLQPALWHNPAEIPGNGKDDDGNGYTDDWYGWDIADNDNDPSVKPSDNLNHGTHCAGILGAVTNNGKGIASIGYNLKILPVKCGKNGQPFIYNGYEGVEYCIKTGARIISMSWGGGAYSATYQAIFDYAYLQGVICVAAAGNSSTSTTMYPAGYNHVIAVGSTTGTDQKSGFSNYGTWVDVMAPGSSIHSTLPGNSYGDLSGTSMACPLVSGLCALMLSKNPIAGADVIENCLKSGCENIDAMNPGFAGNLGAGRVNALNSLRCLKNVSAAFQAARWHVCTGDTVSFYNRSSSNVTQWRWSFPGGTPAVSTAQNPVVRYSAPGKYIVRLWVTDGKEADSLVSADTLVVGIPSLKFSGKQSIHSGDFGTIVASLTGKGPWDITYSDGSNTFTEKGISYTPYFLLVRPSRNTVYKPVSVVQAGCTGMVSDSAVISVLPAPVVGSDCDSAYRFQMYLTDGGKSMQALDLEVANDSTIIMAGYLGAGSSQNGFLASIHAGGKVNWAIHSGGGSEDGFYCVGRDVSGSIYVGGYTWSATSGRAAVMAKYWPNGNLAWRKIYGYGREYIYRVNISANRQFVYFTGLSLDQSYGSEDFTVYKFDTSGNIQWARQCGDADLNRNHQLLETNNGNDLYVIGNGGDAFPVIRGNIVKLNGSGNVIWNKKYQMPTDYQVAFHDVKPWGRDLIVYGYLGLNGGGSTSLTRETLLARIASDGSVKWAKKYTLNSTNPWQLQILDKQILIAGGNAGNGGDGFLMLTDSNGNVLQARNMGTAATEFIYGLRTTNQKEIYFAGSQSTGTSRAWFGKTGCRLNTLCNGISATPAVQNITLNVSNVNWGIKDFNRPVSFNLTETPFTPALTVICKSGVMQKPPCDGSAAFRITDNCLGEPVEFQSTGNVGKYIPESWSWSFGDGNTASGNTVTHTYTKPGTYRVVLKVLKRSGNFTCLDSAVGFYRAADSFRIARMPADTTICLGDSIELASIRFTCANPLLKYRWTPLWINDANAARPWVSPKMTQTYTVEVTDGLGRKATGSVRITVRTNCCKSRARWTMNQPQCEGDTLYFTNASTCKSNAAFTWRFPGTNMPVYNGKQPPGVVFPKSGNYHVTLILSDACNADTAQTILFIFPKPRAFAGRDTLLCKTDSLLLGEEAIGRNQYRWTPAAGLNSAVISQPRVLINAPAKYVLSVLDEQGCRNSDNVTIGYGTPPDMFMGADTTLCIGETMTIGTAGKPGTSYQWNTGARTSFISVSMAGTYRCTAKNLCGEKTDSINVKVDNCLCPVYIPNAFTPAHSPGLNDKHGIIFTCPYHSAVVRIYNR